MTKSIGYLWDSIHNDSILLNNIKYVIVGLVGESGVNLKSEGKQEVVYTWGLRITLLIM